MKWFQKGCSLSSVVFTKKSRKLLPEHWCITSRDKPPEENISSLEKHCVLDLEYRIYLRNLQIAAFCILMSYFIESKLKKISVDSWPQSTTRRCPTTDRLWRHHWTVCYVWQESSMRYFHQTQDTVRRWCQSLSVPIGSVYFIPLSTLWLTGLKAPTN